MAQLVTPRHWPLPAAARPTVLCSNAKVYFVRSLYKAKLWHGSQQCSCAPIFQIMAATLVTNIRVAGMLFCGGTGCRGMATFANGGGTLPSAFSGSSVTTQRAAVAASHGRACAQGHLNLIPTLLSQPMVEQHFIPRGHIITL